jgi:hypothetical protein
MRTAVYRYFDADGRLLYVGVSLSGIARQSQHESGSHWYADHASMTTEWFDTRAEALEAERMAIITEQPIYNVAHRGEVLEETPEARKLTHSQIGRMGAYALHAAGKTTTTAARAQFLSRFEREVDPDGALDPAERARRAQFAKRAYFTKLVLRRHGKIK